MSLATIIGRPREKVPPTQAKGGCALSRLAGGHL